MNTGIAQLVALSAHGNWALHRVHPVKSSSIDQSRLLQYVTELRFELAGEKREAVIDSPSAWFASLRTRGIRRLYFVRLSTASDGPLKGYDRTAFANGEQSAIAAVGHGDSMELWTPQWMSRPQEDQHRWALRYAGYPGGRWSPEWSGATVTAAADSLRQVLSDISAFAAEQNLAHWVPQFDGARALLDEPPPDDAFDLLPPDGYPAPARQLLAAALSGWVFGGMGSWNDTGPSDSAEYARYEGLTQQLFDTIMDAITSATNGFSDDASG
jgi:hypothetical protein